MPAGLGARSLPAGLASVPHWHRDVLAAGCG